jgi:hypothetical protein
VSSSRGLRDGPIPRPEESYRLWCITACYLETLETQAALARVGLLGLRKYLRLETLRYEFVLNTYRQIFYLNNTLGVIKAIAH